jgi:hypothetical protein
MFNKFCFNPEENALKLAGILTKPIQNPEQKRKLILLLRDIELKHNIPGLSEKREVGEIIRILKERDLISI